MEEIYNIYLIYDDDLCSSIAVKSHRVEGSDEEKVAHLIERVESDFKGVEPIMLSKPFTREEHNARCRLGDEIGLLEEVFIKLKAAQEPLFVSTPVKEGKPFFNYSSRHGDFDVHAAAKSTGLGGSMDDWLERYSTDKGIKLSELIHDDYFLAVKTLFNSGLYVSSMKLLVSCIDSIAYIEHGDVPGAFIKWLDNYADLSPLGITAEELWELRNSLLHMTNLNSRKVRKEKVRRISFRVSHPKNSMIDNDSDEIYYFNFMDLVRSFSLAQAKWLSSYNEDREKFVKFVERYDETISDSRLATTLA